MDYLPDLLARRAALSPDKTAMIELSTDRSVIYAQLNDRAARLASVLRQAGIGEGERVVILCRNRIGFFEALFACAKLGAILVPLNWRAPVPELAPLIEMTRPRAFLYGTEDQAAVGALPACGLALGFDDDGPDGYEARLEHARPDPGRAQWPAQDTWYLLFTSGTTGLPKAVIQTYAMAMVNYVNLGQAIDLVSTDVTLNFLPLFHTSGINLHTLPTLLAGGQVLVLPGFEPETMMDLLDAGRLTTFFGVPAIYQGLSLHPRFASVDLTRVRHWGCGGAPLPDTLVHVFADRGAMVCNGFGMTETGPTVFLVDGAAAPRKIGSVGKAQILTEARVTRPDGTEADAGETGEMWMAGPGITPGYWNNPEATAAAFLGRWLKSGDLARKDAEGYTYIVGRLKEMFISGGENVYPAEVENVLARHPDVLEAAVVGAPDEKWGEVGFAYVMARPGCAFDVQSLLAHCKANLAGFKVPRRFIPVADFPRTAAGKVQKHLICEPDGH
jgi:fatty-acyl-CoA synthase